MVPSWRELMCICHLISHALVDKWPSLILAGLDLTYDANDWVHRGLARLKHKGVLNSECIYGADTSPLQS